MHAARDLGQINLVLVNSFLTLFNSSFAVVLLVVALTCFAFRVPFFLFMYIVLLVDVSSLVDLS